MASAGSYGRAVLGRGCDPARAAFAQKAWPALLKAEVFCATSDEELLAHLTSGTRFSAFFVAPGYCSLNRAGRVSAQDLFALVEQHCPGLPVVMIESVEDGLRQLAAALDGTAGDVPTVKTLTQDWPWVD